MMKEKTKDKLFTVGSALGFADSVASILNFFGISFGVIGDTVLVSPFTPVLGGLLMGWGLAMLWARRGLPLDVNALTGGMARAALATLKEDRATCANAFAQDVSLSIQNGDRVFIATGPLDTSNFYFCLEKRWRRYLSDPKVRAELESKAAKVARAASS